MWAAESPVKPVQQQAAEAGAPRQTGSGPPAGSVNDRLQAAAADAAPGSEGPEDLQQTGDARPGSREHGTTHVLQHVLTHCTCLQAVTLGPCL